MKEVRGNLWTWMPGDGWNVTHRVITTNGFVKKDGTAVMGRGCALEAKNMFPGIALQLGNLLRWKGNHVHHVFTHGTEFWELVTFPVKHNWWEMADMELIERSARELVELLDFEAAQVIEGYWQPQRVVLPRPGCGNGQLRWEDVKPVLEKILDDRFYVITF